MTQNARNSGMDGSLQTAVASWNFQVVTSQPIVLQGTNWYTRFSAATLRCSRENKPITTSESGSSCRQKAFNYVPHPTLTKYAEEIRIWREMNYIKSFIDFRTFIVQGKTRFRNRRTNKASHKESSYLLYCFTIVELPQRFQSQD